MAPIGMAMAWCRTTCGDCLLVWKQPGKKGWRMWLWNGRQDWHLINERDFLAWAEIDAHHPEWVTEMRLIYGGED